MAKFQKFLSPAMKAIVLKSFPYRVYSRFQLMSKNIRLSCELTTKCNIHCDMCTRPGLIDQSELLVTDMKPSLVDRLLTEIKIFHEKGFRVSVEPMGLGEPLLYAGLFDFFKKVKNISKSIRLVLVTNGVLLDQKSINSLIDLEVDEICVSLNANNAHDYRNHMGVDCYQRVYQNIELLLRLRNERKAKVPDIFIQYLDYDQKKSNFKSDFKRWVAIMRDEDKCFIHPLVNQAGFFQKTSRIVMNRNKYPCAQPLWRMAVKVNGDIYPCCSCFYSGAKKIISLHLGNLEKDSLYGIFTNPCGKLREIVHSMRRDDYVRLPQCLICDTYLLSSNCYFRLPAFFRFNGRKWL